MPFLQVWIHLVWATKNRESVLSKNLRNDLIPHIRENAQEKSIHLDFLNGYTDHLHCLMSLNQSQTIAKVVQLIKGESSFWINHNNLCDSKFEWQDEYFAVSVSHSQVNKVREYIKNQEQHHQKITFQQEYEEFMVKYGFQRMKG